MSAQIRVLVVDDHALLREGIASALADENDLELVAEAHDGRTAIRQYRVHRPDVTLMDVRLPDITGIEAMRLIRAQDPEARIIMLTSYRGDVQVRSALHHGAIGFLLKTALRKELKNAIRDAHEGKRVISEEVAVDLAEHLRHDELTPREIEVLHKSAYGLGNREIAFALQVSEDTVKVHMKKILRKLDAGDRTHAVFVAIKRGILSVYN